MKYRIIFQSIGSNGSLSNQNIYYVNKGKYKTLRNATINDKSLR